MPNRYMCSALEEMREQLKVLSEFNIERYRSITAMLIEEIQTMGNRMEAHLRDQAQLERLHTKIRAAKRKLKNLESKLDESNNNGSISSLERITRFSEDFLDE